MECIIEFIIDLFVEGSISICNNAKANKFLRYFFGILLVVLSLLVVFLIFFVSLLSFKENQILGLILINVSIIMFYYVIHKTVVTYRKINNKE